MSRIGHVLTLGVVAALTVLAFAGDGLPQDSFTQEWKALIKAAQAEGKLSVAFGGGASARYRPVATQFAKLFNLKLLFHAGSGRSQADRILAERRAGRYTVDVIAAGQSTVTQRLIPAGVLDPLKPLFIHPDIVDTSRWYGGRHWWGDPEEKYLFIFQATADAAPFRPFYNTDRVSQADVDAINSVWDYLNPKWKGQIAATPPIGNRSAFWRLYLLPGVGPEWIKRFILQMKVHWVGGDTRLTVDGLARGRYAWVMFADGPTGADIKDLKKLGLPLNRVTKPLKEPGGLSASGSSRNISVVNRAPNPNAAKLFVNWWLSFEGQNAVHDLSARAPAQSLLEGVRVDRVDPDILRQPGVNYRFMHAEPEAKLRMGEAFKFAAQLYESIR